MTTLTTSRRGLITAVAAGTALAGAGSIQMTTAQPGQKTFVLVHGAWHGEWCWMRVARMLRARGHEVFATTLTGVCERSHLLSGTVNLDTHIADVTNLVKWNDLANIVLVGHSYGGMVISGVAEQILPSIASIVFLDAFMPENGQSSVDPLPPERAAPLHAAAQRGDISVKPIPAAVFNVNEKDRAWVDSKMTPQPIGTIFQKSVLTGARDRVAKKTYIRARGFQSPTFDAHYAKCKADQTCRAYELPCGHDVMVDMPERLTEILLEVA